jgi:hypothetical protein
MYKCTTGTFLYKHATDSRGTRIFPSSCHTSTTEDQQFGAKGRLVVIHITALSKGISRSNMYKGLGLSGSHRREVARQGASRTQERHITFFLFVTNGRWRGCSVEPTGILWYKVDEITVCKAI